MFPHLTMKSSRETVSKLALRKVTFWLYFAALLKPPRRTDCRPSLASSDNRARAYSKQDRSTTPNFTTAFALLYQIEALLDRFSTTANIIRPWSVIALLLSLLQAIYIPSAHM